MGTSTSFVDYYEVLGVATDAAPAQIRAAFIKLAKENHPDKGGTTEAMQLCTTAYRTVIDPTTRRAYDLKHSFYSDGLSRYSDDSDIVSSLSDSSKLGDEDIDAFLDSIYAEYRAQALAKKSQFSRLKQWLFES